MMMASQNKNPVFVAQDKPKQFVWRIRNLPYPKDTYALTVDEEKQQLVLRTTNKKYFKRFDVPALKRLGLALDPRLIGCDHKNSTLVVTYEKPPQVLEVEAGQRASRVKKASGGGGGGGGGGGEAPECKQQ